MNLWIDDVREEPEGWAVARTYADAYRLLGRFPYEVVSFDHDLGDEGSPTGYDLLCAIERGDLPCPPEIRIHSMNPVGRQRMAVVAQRLRGA
jgi:hypothetical protein